MRCIQYSQYSLVFHLFLTSGSSLNRPKLLTSSLTKSYEVFLECRLRPVPSISIVMHCLTKSTSSSCSIRPNHHNLSLPITKLIDSSPNKLRIFFLSFNVNPHIHLIIVQLTLPHTLTMTTLQLPLLIQISLVPVHNQYYRYHQ